MNKLDDVTYIWDINRGWVDTFIYPESIHTEQVYDDLKFPSLDDMEFQTASGSTVKVTWGN